MLDPNDAWRAKRYFSPAEAEAMVPYLEDKFQMITGLRRKVGTLVDKLEKSGVDALETDLDDPIESDDESAQELTEEQAEDIRQLRKMVGRINGALSEVTELGIVVKDIETGVVDFFARMGDRDVFLCWQLGEKRITHWHSVDVGYAGRRPIREEQFAAYALN